MDLGGGLDGEAATHSNPAHTYYLSLPVPGLDCCCYPRIQGGPPCAQRMLNFTIMSNTLKIKATTKKKTTDNLLNTQVKIKCFSKPYMSQIKDIITTQYITNKRYNNTVYHSSKFCGGVIIWGIFNPVTQVIPQGLSNHPLSFCKHVLMLWVLVLGFLLISGFFVIFNGGYEATPLRAARVPLIVGGSILHQGRRCQFFPLPDAEGYLPISLPPPCLALPTMTQCGEWSHPSRGSLSASINRHWHHSLHCHMHVFLPMSTATSHYLRSSPILGGCSGRHPW